MQSDVIQLKFFTEFVWLVDYTIFVLFVYIITEVSAYALISHACCKAL